MDCRRLLAQTPLVMAALCSLVSAAPPQKAYISGPKNDAAPYVGVLGAVVRPGVYTLTGPQTPILEVLQQAGGPAPEATGNIRLVRGGKAGQQLFLSPSLPFMIQPGDVLVLDGPQPSRRTTIHRAAHVTGTPHGTEIWRRDPKPATAEAPSVVPIALVNVIERPVVMKIRGEHATVEKLVELLGQSPEIAPSVKILPTVAQVPGDAPLTTKTRLPAGTVLVFNRSQIDPNSIPALPPAKAVEKTSLTSEAPATRYASQADAEAIRRMSPSAITLPGPEAREIGPTLGPSTGMPLLPSSAAPSVNYQFAAGPNEPAPDRTANKLSRTDAPPSGDSLRTEFLPPPASETGEVPGSSVTLLKEPVESGPSMMPVSPRMEREVIGYSEPIDAGDRMNAKNLANRQYNTADSSPLFGGPSESLTPREIAAQRAQQALASGFSSRPSGNPEAVTASLSSKEIPTVDEEEADSNAMTAIVWGLFGIGALYAGWRSANKRRMAMKTQQPAASVAVKISTPRKSLRATPSLPVEPVAAIERDASISHRLASRLDRLIANQLPIDIEPVRMAEPMMLFGRPRSPQPQRLDASHPMAELRPHFTRSESTAPERVPQAMETEAPMPSPAASVLSGHRLDEAHGESRMPGGILSRPHIGERKSDILERALANAAEGGMRTSAPMASAHSKDIEPAVGEGATAQ